MSLVYCMHKIMDFARITVIFASAMVLTSSTQHLHERCQRDADCIAANATCVNVTTHSYCDCKAGYVMMNNITCTKVFWNAAVSFIYINATTYNITWNDITPHTEPIFYYVVIFANFHSAAPSLTPCLNSTSTYCIVPDFIPFVEYDYHILATGLPNHRLGKTSGQFKTKQSTPGIVNAIIIRQGKYSDGEITAKWTMNGTQLHGTLTTFLVNVYKPGGTGVPLKSFSVPITYSFWNTGWQQKVKVHGNKMYSLGIKAVNDYQQTGSEVLTTFKTMTWRPPNPIITAIYSDPTNTTMSTFNIKIQRYFFLNDAHGPIIDYGLIVAKQFKFFGGSMLQQGYFMTMNSWALSSNDNDFTAYRATPYKWDIFKGMNKSDKYSPFTIGASNCSKLFVKYIFCNGPLHAGFKYDVYGFACTSGGCTITRSYGPFSTNDDHTTPTTTAVILVAVFSVFGGLLLIGLVGVYFTCRNKQRSTTIPLQRKY